MKYLFLTLIALVSACGWDDAPSKGGGTNPPIDPNTPYLLELRSPADFDALAEEGSLKYLANLAGKKEDREGPLREDMYWISSTLFPWHHQFLASFEEYADVDLRIYSRWVLYENLRKFYGGVLQYWAGIKHPKTGVEGVYTFTLYTAAGHMKLEDIELVYERVKSSAPFAKDQIVFTTEYAHQKVWLNTFKSKLDKKGIPYLFPNELIGTTPIVYSDGEGYGNLKITAAGEVLKNYGPLDIVIVESAPNDISIVQALITRDPQNELSHTNLRLREKDIPNVALASIYTYENLAELEDKLVHVVANKGEFFIEEATLADAQAFWNLRKKKLPDVKSDLNILEFRGYEGMKNEDAIAYGAKAANLGELYSILPIENANPGFGIPFSAYVEHIEDNGLRAQIEDMLSDEQMKRDAAFKRQSLRKLRRAIKRAPISEAFLRRLEAQIVATFGPEFRTKRIKFRSSTNVEDLDEITGAGLYSSKSGCIADDFDGDEEGPSLCLSAAEKAQKEALLADAKTAFAAHPDRFYLVDIIDDLEGDLADEKPVAAALGKVWASLWNERAYDEREYYGIDHRKAFMGMAVNPSFVLEKVNAVALTELQVDEGLPLYRVNSQIGEESVVQPDNPNAIGEILTFRRDGDRLSMIDVLVPSSLKQEGERIWTDAQLQTLGGLLFLVHDHFSTKVYSHIDNFSLDVEIKLTSDDRIVLKQARPFTW